MIRPHLFILFIMDIRGFFGGNKSVGKTNAKDVVTPKEEKILSKNNEATATNILVPVKSSISSSTCKTEASTPGAKIESNISVSIGEINWSSGENVPYAAVVSTFEFVSSSSARLDKESLFCRLFVAVIKTKPDDLDCVVHLASNTLRPAYEGLELGIGDSLLVKAICEGTS